MRVRGLKPIEDICDNFANLSHPMRVRGLKLIMALLALAFRLSHPMRVRGLKPAYRDYCPRCVSRTPCGCVD